MRPRYRALGWFNEDQLNQAEKKLHQHGVSPADILAFGQWWQAHDWRSKRGDSPFPHQVRQEWGRFAHGSTTPQPTVP